MKSKLLGHGANDLFWFILPLVLPTLLVRYNLSFSPAGGLLTIYLAVMALFSFGIGKFSDHFSRKKIISYGLILASAGLASSGFAPSLGIFLILISFTAVGVSTFHPVMYAVIDDAYSEKKGHILGAYEGAGTLAVLVMFLVNGFLLSRIGVKGVLILTALPAFIMGLFFLFSGAIPANPVISHKIKGQLRTDKKIVYHFIILLVSIILRVFSVTAVLNFLPTIFVSFLGYADNSASYATAFVFMGALIGSLIVGKLTDRYKNFSILSVGTLFLIPALFSFTLDLPIRVYLISSIVFGFFNAICNVNQNLLIGLMGKHLGKGEVFGILMGVMTITSSLSPALFGFLIDHTGFGPALILYLIPLFLSVLLVVLLKLLTTRVSLSGLSADES
jgi:MFS family permease